jgi:hypothetical protein
VVAQCSQTRGDKIEMSFWQLFDELAEAVAGGDDLEVQGGLGTSYATGLGGYRSVMLAGVCVP